jgi:hypothetical protein
MDQRVGYSRSVRRGDDTLDLAEAYGDWATSAGGTDEPFVADSISIHRWVNCGVEHVSRRRR